MNVDIEHMVSFVFYADSISERWEHRCKGIIEPTNVLIVKLVKCYTCRIYPRTPSKFIGMNTCLKLHSVRKFFVCNVLGNKGVHCFTDSEKCFRHVFATEFFSLI